MWLERDKFSDAWAGEQKHVFRLGYPPSGSIFDADFWLTYNAAFAEWVIIIQQMELLWVTRDNALVFSSLEVDLIVKKATFLNSTWREDLACFFRKYYKIYVEPEKLMLVFLSVSQMEENVELETYLLSCPIMFLTEFVQIRN